MKANSWTKPLTASEQEAMIEMASLNVQPGFENVGSLKATSAALSNRLMDRMDNQANENNLVLDSEAMSRLADVLSNVVRDIKTVNAWKSSNAQPMTHGDIEIDMDDDAIPTLIRAASLQNSCGDIDEVVAQALEQLAIFAHSSLHEYFFKDRALGLMVNYASSPHHSVRCAAAAGIANLLMLKEAADDSVFRAKLLQQVPSLLGAIRCLVEDESVLCAGLGEKTSIFTPSNSASDNVTPASLGQKIEGGQKLGFGGMGSLPLAKHAHVDREGPGGLVNSMEHALIKTLLHLSTMPRPQAKPGTRPTAETMKTVRQGMILVTQHFYSDGGLQALCSLAGRHCWAETTASTGNISSDDSALMSMLAHTVLNLAHMATEPALLQMTVSFLQCPIPRVHTPAVGTICKLARAPEAQEELVRHGTVDALRAFVSPDFIVVEEIVEGKVPQAREAHSSSRIVQAAKHALQALQKLQKPQVT